MYVSSVVIASVKTALVNCYLACVFGIYLCPYIIARYQLRSSQSNQLIVPLVKLLYRPKPIHCNYQYVHYSGFRRISPSILNRFKPNLQMFNAKKHVSVNFSSFLPQAVSEHGAAATFFVPLCVSRCSESLDCLALA